MIDINNYKKDRTVCKTCYNKNKTKNNNFILTPKRPQDDIKQTR